MERQTEKYMERQTEKYMERQTDKKLTLKFERRTRICRCRSLRPVDALERIFLK